MSRRCIGSRKVCAKGPECLNATRKERAQGAAKLFGLGPGQEPRRASAACRIDHHRYHRGLGRHAGWTCFQGLSAGRPVGGTSAGVDGRRSAGFRHPAAPRQFHRLGCGGDPVGSGSRPRRALNMLRFFEDESCGQCTPCRVGCEKAVKLMQADSWDQALLEELCTRWPTPRSAAWARRRRTRSG